MPKRFEVRRMGPLNFEVWDTIEKRRVSVHGGERFAVDAAEEAERGATDDDMDADDHKAMGRLGRRALGLSD